MRAGVGRRFIVGPDDGVESGIVVEPARDALQGVGMNANIGVEEEEEIGSGGEGAQIARGRGAFRATRRDDLKPERPGYIPGAIR